ncbi:MAG: polysaccharide biosynthesis protein [Flavobacteriales bacterium]|jgi:FlaA1/EpsC-like NDP-sugar epimerase|nr:polysaccharide biosynthesis protein [Flavobacteriales bacterium]
MNLLPKKNTPRWVIFLIDMLLCFLALGTAYLIRFDFVNIDTAKAIKEWEILKLALPIYVLVRAISFVLGKTYAGIIRYTSTQDAKRIFLVVTIGSLFFLGLVPIRFYYGDGFFFLPLSIILVDYLATIFLLITSRILVKLVYVETQKSRGATKNVIIYGAGEMGLITKRTLERDTNILYNVIGFVDENPKLRGKLLERTPIKSKRFIKKWVEKNQIDHVIIAIKSPNPVNTRKLIDICLELEVEVLSVPPIEDWINGQFSSNQIKKVKIEDLLGRDQIELSTLNIENQINGKVVLITGAAGSIGSEMARQILNFQPSEVILLDQAESPLYNLDIELKSTGSTIKKTVVIADVSNPVRMKNVFQHFKPEIVFHAAAYKHVPLMEDNPSEAIKVNINGSKILADMAHQFNVESFVMISTDKAVNPTNVMGASKRIAEIYIQALNKNSSTQFITTRFGNVLGSNGSVIPLFKRQIEKGGPLTVTHEKVTRYFMTIPEACQLVLEAGSMGKGGEIFVFDMGESVKIIDLARKMIQLSGLKEGVDIAIKITGLRPGEKLYEELLNQEETTLPTHHKKIMVGKVKEYCYETVAQQIEQLIQDYNSQDNYAIVKQMKALVPEFVSNNSEFSELDVK